MQMYSTNQRALMLNAISFAVKELAYGQTRKLAEPLFPSRRLEGWKHAEYLPHGDVESRFSNPLLLGNPKSLPNSHVRDGLGVVVRTKQLRITRLQNLGKKLNSGVVSWTGKFNQIAAEYFIMPFINQFWGYLREDHSRTLRTRYTPSAYKGSGTGLILNPLILSHFLKALGIMLHSAQNSPAYLAILAPETLELSLATGNQPLSSPDTSAYNNFASVLSCSLELSLVVLAGSRELDRGKCLCLDHASLILATGEWAERVIEQLENGLRFSGGGGALEANLFQNALGVAKEVSEIASVWKASMVDIN